jgi:hypothetical protein
MPHSTGEVISHFKCTGTVPVPVFSSKSEKVTLSFFFKIYRYFLFQTPTLMKELPSFFIRRDTALV